MEGKSGSDDVYEFKSSKEATPVRGSSASPDVEKQDGTGTVADVKENNSPLRPEGGGEQSSKRSFSDVQDSEEGDEENKRRKHKDSDCGKDSSRNGGSSGRFSSGRKGNSGGKCVKSCNDGKNGSNTGTKGTGSNDRKSPNNTTSSTGNSPKPSGGSGKSSTNIGNESDGDKEIRSTKGSSNSSDNSGGGSCVWTGAPKVPPLKIVIPQQNSSIEQEQGNRNGKNGTARHHQALPYVVASSNSGEGGNEKEGTGSGQNVQTSTGQSDSSTPGNQVKGDDKKETGTGNTTSEEQRSSHHQRVLRSSHRSGGSNSSGGSGSGSQSTMSSSLGGSLSSSGTTSVSSASSPSPVSNSANADRSNNSSPQQSGSQRQTPSPTGSSTTVSTENNAALVSKNSSSNTSNTLNTEEKGSESMEQCNQQQHQSASSQQSPAVELHPRKRKMKQNKESQAAAATASTTTNTTSSTITESTETSNTTAEVNPHELALNSYQLYLNIRKQIDKRRKSLFPVQPKPPQGFKDYLMNRCTYVLAGSQSTNRPMPLLVPPPSLQSALKDLFQDQEKERHRLRMQHVIEKEKLVLSVEQEILRVHGRAARALANQSLPFSVCTILKDEEVYNIMTADQEDKEQNARSRYNGRLFLSWLQDVDDKWEKIKETMLLRHHNEAETLHAVQKMDWEWKMKELAICEFKTKPVIDDQHVPKVQVHDDFDLLPA